MTRARYASYLNLLYIVALLALLGVLAILQYRWTGEASLAEQERLRQGLNESLGFFERSFDREIGQIVLTYWGLPFSTVAETTDWQPVLSRLLADASGQWQASADDLRLIKRILVAESSQDSLPRLYSFATPTNKLEAIDWPSDLIRVRKMLHPEVEESPRLPEMVPGESQERRHLPTHFLLDEVPALVTFVVPPLETFPRERLESGGRRPVRALLCLIICLDRQYLFNERIPALARRYLLTDGDNGYDYAITSRQNPQLILCSSRGEHAQTVLEAPDGQIELFRLHEELPTRRRNGGPRDQELELRESTERRRPPMAGGGGGGVPGGEIRESDRRAEEVAIKRMSQLQAAVELFASRGWLVSAKHRSGSLNAAVAGTRLRNLAVSLGILLLLAVSLVVLAISVRRAQRLSKQQMEFVAGVSHELRTPIAVICSTAENLADGVVTASDQVRRYGQYILREGWRLGTLVEQTMEFAGIGSGIRRFHMESVDVSHIIGETIDDFRRQITEKKLDLEVSATPGALVTGDAAALGCAIGNLVSNAVKYSRPGGKIQVLLEVESGAETVLIKVADQGMGIAPADVKRVFEPFFRGRNAVEAQVRGLGIGLSLVKRIVDAHHGSISVESRVEQGSMFTLALPLAQVHATAERQEVT